MTPGHARWFTCLLAGACALHAPASAQESGELQKVEMRVVSSRPGSATIDRGSDDGLRRGDRVTFRMRDGSVSYGVISRADERAAIVDLDDQSSEPPPGTRVEAMVPKSRFAAPEVAPVAPVEQQSLPPSTPEHPAWPKRDDAWTEGEALLARVRPLRPSERPRDIRGSIFAIGDYTRFSGDHRSNGFFRLGSQVTMDNVSGRGDTLNFEGEVSYRNNRVPDPDDETSTYLLVNRASYAVGGDRFDGSRLEVGRFLHYNMPEFGVTDGAEWDYRLDGGDRFGISAGFMPEPDPDFSSIQDFQVSASYRWIYDESEQLSAALGFQQTLHNSSIDRDLLVAQFQYLPLHSWTFTSTAWIDYYTADDAAKGQGVELTQAYVNSGRNWDDGSSLHLVYSHLAYPEMDRDEFTPVTAQQLADDRNDRIALQARATITDPLRLHGLIAAWNDQDDSGGDGEAGMEVDHVFSDDILIDLSGFFTDGKFVSIVGARATLVRTHDGGRESLFYELANNRFDGFTSTNDDLPQHHIGATVDVYSVSGWTVSGHADVLLWADDSSVTLGFFLQRSF